jgi:hypothetical protein
MRSLVIMLAVGCTGTISSNLGDHSSLSTRVTDACSELATACATGQDCLGLASFCGSAQAQIGVFFTAETACKAACSDVTCQRDCKTTRIAGINTMISTAAGACTQMTQTCATGGTGCGATEFMCMMAQPQPDACYQQLVTCKAACGHDHTCKYECKQAYLQCEAGGTTSDAGVPDSPPTTTPDAATTTPDAPATTPDASTTTTAYTYTNDISGVTTNFCSGCHSGNAPPGNYLTDTYSHLFGNGSDNTPNIVPGDPTSLFVVKIQGDHHNVLSVYPGFDKIAYDWVVNNAAKQ